MFHKGFQRTSVLQQWGRHAREKRVFEDWMGARPKNLCVHNYGRRAEEKQVLKIGHVQKDSNKYPLCATLQKWDGRAGKKGAIMN